MSNTASEHGTLITCERGVATFAEGYVEAIKPTSGTGVQKPAIPSKPPESFNQAQSKSGLS